MSECKTGTTGNDSDSNPIVIDFYKLNIPAGKPNDFQWLVWIRLVDLNKDNKLDIIAREGTNIEMKWINDGNNHFKLQK